MTADNPIACTLNAADLRLRLDALAEIGADSLISRTVEGGRHLLRFRAAPGTWRRLEEIVAAEARCCSFLDLVLEDRGEELVLAIAAPPGAGAVAAELAAAFAKTPA